MKFTHKLILLGLGGALVAPMFIKGPNGKTFMSVDDWIPKDAIALFDKGADMIDSSSSSKDSPSGSGKQTFFKWKDENGVWQMTQFRPTHLQDDEVEARTVYANANIIQSMDKSDIATALNSGHQEEKQKAKFNYNPLQPDKLLEGEGSDGSEEEGFSLSTISLKKIPELMNQAQSLDGVSKDRMKQLDQMSR